MSLELIRLFLAVAEYGSFTLAARRLNVSPTAVSKGVRALERRHGVSLFARNTRSVALTDAGAALLASLKPAVGQIDEAFAALAQFQDRPSGLLKVTAPRAFGFLLARHLLPRMREKYPDITFDLSLDDGLVDLVAAGYDAGVRLGQAIAQDMVAIRLSRPLSWSVVASPAYLARHGTPTTPQDLLQHNCIAFHIAGRPARTWRFGRDGQWTEVRVKGNRTADDAALARDWAIAGHGIIYKSVPYLHHELHHSPLVRLLPEWDTPPYPLQALLPSGRFVPARVRALVDFLVAKFDGLPQE